MTEPQNTFPAAISEPILVTEGEGISVALSPILVYPTGILFQVVYITKEPLKFDPYTEEFIQVTARFSDGTCSSEELRFRSGSYDDYWMMNRYWLPFLGEGDITIHCKWNAVSLDGSCVIERKVLDDLTALTYTVS